MPATLKLARPDAPREPSRLPFTKRALEALKPTTKQRYVYDTQVPGLAMLITPADARTFYLAKRIDGRYTRVKIGSFPGVTVEQARKVAAGLLGKVAAGRNPAEERKQARADSTVGQLWHAYLERYAKVHKRTWKEDERQYLAHLQPWAGRRLDQVSKADVQALHAKLGKTAPIAANRLLALVSKLFTTAQDMGFTGANPARGVRKFKEAERSRYLEAGELARFLESIEAEPNDTLRDFFRMLLFTGQRRGNVQAMRWPDVDLQRRTWTIPAEQFKTGETVVVPLVEQAVVLLEARRNAITDPTDPRSAYVFPSHRREGNTPHLSEPKAAFCALCQRADLSDFRLHDIRRTVASWATTLGIPYPVVARIMGHAVQGTTGIYARFDLSAVRDGLQRTVDAMLAPQQEVEA